VSRESLVTITIHIHYSQFTIDHSPPDSYRDTVNSDKLTMRSKDRRQQEECVS